MSSKKLWPLARLANRCRSLSPCRLSNSPVRYHWSRSWNDGFNELQRNMDRMFREFERMPSIFPRPWFVHVREVPVETVSKDGQRLYKIELDLPDFRPEDINVTVKNNVVTIKAKKESEDSGIKQQKEYLYQYNLPQEVNPELIRSMLDSNGILTIEAPLPEAKKPETQEIKVNIKKD